MLAPTPEGARVMRTVIGLSGISLFVLVALVRACFPA